MFVKLKGAVQVSEREVELVETVVRVGSEDIRRGKRRVGFYRLAGVMADCDIPVGTHCVAPLKGSHEAGCYVQQAQRCWVVSVLGFGLFRGWRCVDVALTAVVGWPSDDVGAAVVRSRRGMPAGLARRWPKLG